MEFIRDVIHYNGAIVDNTDDNKRVVVLTDKEGESYKQVFFVGVSDNELIERTKTMRDLKIKSF